MTRNEEEKRSNEFLALQLGNDFAKAWPRLGLTWGGGKPLTFLFEGAELPVEPPRDLSEFLSWFSTILRWGVQMAPMPPWKKPKGPATAQDVATWAHAMQRYGNAPYMTHVEEVVEIAKTLPATSLREEVHRKQLIEVAYLHDVLEDTLLTEDDLRRRFGPVVSVAVATVTDEELPTRRERKDALHRRFSIVTEEVLPYRLAILVKVADRLANVRACVRDKNDSLLSMYKREHAAFRSAVYRTDLCETWWEELDSLMCG